MSQCLLRAISEDDSETAIKLLDENNSLKAKDRRGNNALHLAAHKNK